MKTAYTLNYNSIIFHLHYVLFKINIILIYYKKFQVFYL